MSRRGPGDFPGFPAAGLERGASRTVSRVVTGLPESKAACRRQQVTTRAMLPGTVPAGTQNESGAG